MNKKPFKSFVEYMDSKGKLIEKPETKVVASFDDTPPDSPEKGEGQKEKPAPYSNPSKKFKTSFEPEEGLGDIGDKIPATKEPNQGEGLGHEGDEKLVYEPKVSSVGEWVEKTKNLNVSELAKTISENNYGISNDLHTIIKETVELCKDKNFAAVLKAVLKKNNII